MMHFIRTTYFAAAALAIGAFFSTADAGTVAIAVIPEVTEGDGGTFVIPEGGTDQMVELTFDVSAVPANASIESVILRLTPVGTSGGSQVVRIFQDSDRNTSVGAINVSQSDAPVESTGDGLIALVSGDPAALKLALGTSAARVSRTYYSAASASAITRPRLIVNWTDESPAVIANGNQLRYRGRIENATPWRVNAPTGALLSNLFAPDQILTGAAFVGEAIVVVAKKASVTKLYGISPSGQMLWSYPAGDATLDDKPWKYLRVDDRGRLLAFRNDGFIYVFENFGAAGPAEMSSQKVPQLRLSKRPVMNTGGLISFRHDGTTDNPGSYIYALSPWPGLTPLWRSPGTVGKSTAPVLSPALGNHLVYVIGQEASAGLNVLDSTRGDLTFGQGFPTGSGLGDFDGFLPPLVVNADPSNANQSDWVYLAGRGVGSGRLEGYTDITDQSGNPGGWKLPQEGALSQCMSPPVEPGVSPIVYCVQSDRFRAYAFNDGSLLCESEQAALQATSNLLADGNGNIYFWQENASESGVLHGFSPECTPAFSQPLTGVPAKTDGSDLVDLRIGPNGVFYLTSDAALLAIRLTGLNAAPTQLNENTQYSSNGAMKIANTNAPSTGPVELYAGGALSLGNMALPVGGDVTCAARESVSFGPGFSVEKGGVLRCRIDTTTPLTPKQ